MIAPMLPDFRAPSPLSKPGSPLAVVVLGVAWVMIGVLAALSVRTLADAVDDMETRLFARQLVMPVPGVQPALLRDTYGERRGEELHHALDIVAPRGTPVMATDDGRVLKLVDGAPGELVIYQSDPGNEVVYRYAHLERYASGLREGSRIRRGEIIGYVGAGGDRRTGDAPHLRFAILTLPPDGAWWKGSPINPLPLYRNSAAH